MLVKSKFFVALLLRLYGASIVASSNEYHKVVPLSPASRPPVVIPISVDLDFLHCPSHYILDPKSIIFTGSVTFEPNADAIRYYMQEILPFLHVMIANLQLKVTCDHSGFSTALWTGNPAVPFLGFLDDIRRLICESWMSILPLRQGMGTSLKIIESMALGTPVVSKSKRAEKTQVTPEFYILIADTPQLFAEQMTRLLRDPLLRTRLSIYGRSTVEKFFDRAMTGKQLDELLHKMQKR